MFVPYPSQRNVVGFIHYAGHCRRENLGFVRRAAIPSAGGVLREADSARTPESKVRVWSRSLDPIDSIGQLLSISVGRNTPAEGIVNYGKYCIGKARSKILVMMWEEERIFAVRIGILKTRRCIEFIACTSSVIEAQG
jgi:hypothetical protein